MFSLLRYRMYFVWRIQIFNGKHFNPIRTSKYLTVQTLIDRTTRLRLLAIHIHTYAVSVGRMCDTT